MVYSIGIGAPQLGVRIIESIHMTTTVEDWSEVRSPGRARRRMARGHKQNITYRQIPRRDAVFIDGGRTMVVHPVFKQELGRRIADQMDRRMEQSLTKSIFGEWAR